jgi:hypothetical protein
MNHHKHLPPRHLRKSSTIVSLTGHCTSRWLIMMQEKTVDTSCPEQLQRKCFIRHVCFVDMCACRLYSPLPSSSLLIDTKTSLNFIKGYWLLGTQYRTNVYDVVELLQKHSDKLWHLCKRIWQRKRQETVQLFCCFKRALWLTLYVLHPPLGREYLLVYCSTYTLVLFPVLNAICHVLKMHNLV